MNGDDDDCGWNNEEAGAWEEDAAVCGCCCGETCEGRICEAAPNIFFVRLRAIAVNPPGLTDISRLLVFDSCEELFAGLDLLSANCKSENNGLPDDPELLFDLCPFEEVECDDDADAGRKLDAGANGVVA